MRRFRFYDGSHFTATLTQVQKRTAEEMAARKHRSSLLRDARRKMKKENQGKKF